MGESADCLVLFGSRINWPPNSPEHFRINVHIHISSINCWLWEKSTTISHTIGSTLIDCVKPLSTVLQASRGPVFSKLSVDNCPKLFDWVESKAMVCVLISYAFGGHSGGKSDSRWPNMLVLLSIQRTPNPIQVPKLICFNNIPETFKKLSLDCYF